MNGFEGFDEISVPDQWDDIVRRSQSDGSDDRIHPRGRLRRGRFVTAAAAALVVLAVGALVLLTRESGVVVAPADSSRSTESATTPTTGVIATGPSIESPTTSAAQSTVVEVPPLPCASAADLARIAELFPIGVPLVDYDAASNLTDLVDKSDVVVVGAVSSIGQVDQGVFEVIEVEVIAGEGSVERFGATRPDGSGSGGWTRAVEGLRVVAFLNSSESQPGGWVARLDGLMVGCAGTPAVAYVSIGIVDEVVEGLTVEEIADAVRTIGEPLERPVVAGDRCPPSSAREGLFEASDAFVLFAIPSDEPVAIQIVAEPGTTPADPFALVERFAAGSSSSAESRAGNGDGSVRTYENGNGDAFVRFDDGSIGYVRTRGLSVGDIQTIVESLDPMPAGAAFPGFAIEDSTGRFASLHEQMSNEVTGSGASSECSVDAEAATAGFTLGYRLDVLAGDPIYQFAGVIDRPVPLEVEMRGSVVLIISGLDDPAAPRVSDIVKADAGEWARLLGQPSVF